jgi:DNA (cytosine-5)-methyltransferase 1
MKYLSVCSGIEAASVAWHPLGWEPVAFSEIEKFPSAVLAHHYPTVPNLGDMTKFKEWPDEPVELLVGGTPCQSFSVAGLRKGLEDPRGNLMLTYLAIAQRYRPRWLVWENVPGVLSSNGGRDFGTFLGALGELGYGWAYRVLDAQWFGVAQRRRRVFVVAHLGDAQRAAKVLFERESVQRNPAPSREARQGAAAGVGNGTYLGNAEGGALDAPYLTCSNIQSQVNNQTPLIAQPIAFHARAQACQLPGLDRDTSISDSLTRSQQAAVAQSVAFRETADCLTSAYGTKWNGNASADNGSLFAAQPVAFSIMPMNSGKDYKAREVDVAQPLMAAGPVGGNQGGDFVAQPVGTDCYNGAITGDVAATLGTPGSSVNASGPTVMQPVGIFQDSEFGVQQYDSAGTLRAGRIPEHQMVMQPIGIDEEQNACVDGFGTLKARMEGGGFEGSVMTPSMQVRRLTPVECERLQGFPDDYTNIPWRKKPEAPDGPRYKALGNSMAVPCMAWIGQRIAEVDRGD